jgi:hypothetical protein
MYSRIWYIVSAFCELTRTPPCLRTSAIKAKEQLDLEKLSLFVNSTAGLLKAIRFYGKGPGPPPIRMRRSDTFKDYFGGKMAFALSDIIDDVSARYSCCVFQHH